MECLPCASIGRPCPPNCILHVYFPNQNSMHNFHTLFNVFGIVVDGMIEQIHRVNGAAFAQFLANDLVPFLNPVNALIQNLDLQLNANEVLIQNLNLQLNANAALIQNLNLQLNANEALIPNPNAPLNANEAPFPAVEYEEVPPEVPPVVDPDEEDFFNDLFDDAPNPVVEEVPPEVPPVVDPGFEDFLNDLFVDDPLPAGEHEEVPPVEDQVPPVPGHLADAADVLHANLPDPVAVPVVEDFFADVPNPVVEEVPPEVPPPVVDPGFEDFLNDFFVDVPLPAGEHEEVPPVEDQVPPVPGHLADAADVLIHEDNPADAVNIADPAQPLAAAAGLRRSTRIRSLPRWLHNFLCY